MIARPRRNRLTPFGEIEATPYRGTLMANRGDLHGDDGSVVRDWKLKRWISCVLHDPGGSRVVFDTPGTYTPLFALDEAVAMAAGHRPCASCRRDDYRAFRSAWMRGVIGSEITVPSASAIDDELHRWRMSPTAGLATLQFLRDLPVGVFFRLPTDRRRAWLWTGRSMREWSHAGYADDQSPSSGRMVVITPWPMIAVMRSGYVPRSFGHRAS